LIQISPCLQVSIIRKCGICPKNVILFLGDWHKKAAKNDAKLGDDIREAANNETSNYLFGKLINWNCDDEENQ
jgi:hypothetical protein